MKLRRRERRDLQSLLSLIVSWWVGILVTGALGLGWWWAFKTAGVLTISSVTTVAVIYLRRDPR